MQSSQGQKIVIPFAQPAEIVRAIRYVNELVAESSWKQKVDDVRNLSVDFFAIGDDWRGEFDVLKAHCEVMYLPRTQQISTTRLKSTLKTLSSVSGEDLNFALEVLTTLSKDFE